MLRHLWTTLQFLHNINTLEMEKYQTFLNVSSQVGFASFL